MITMSSIYLYLKGEEDLRNFLKRRSNIFQLKKIMYAIVLPFFSLMIYLYLHARKRIGENKCALCATDLLSFFVLAFLSISLFTSPLISSNVTISSTEAITTPSSRNTKSWQRIVIGRNHYLVCPPYPLHS